MTSTIPACRRKSELVKEGSVAIQHTIVECPWDQILRDTLHEPMPGIEEGEPTCLDQDWVGLASPAGKSIGQITEKARAN